MFINSCRAQTEEDELLCVLTGTSLSYYHPKVQIKTDGAVASCVFSQLAPAAILNWFGFSSFSLFSGSCSHEHSNHLHKAYEAFKVMLLII